MSAIESGPVLSEAWARIRSRPAAILGPQVLIAAPALIAQLVASHGLVQIIAALLDPQPEGLPQSSIRWFFGGAWAFVLVHLLVRPWVEVRTAVLAIDAQMSESRGLWNAAATIQALRWLLPWTLLIAPAAIGGVLAARLAATGEIHAGAILMIAALVMIGAVICSIGAAYLQLTTAMAFAAIAARGANWREAFQDARARLKGTVGAAVVLWTLIAVIDLGATWAAAEIPHLLGPDLPIAELSPETLLALLPGLERLQAWIFVAAAVAQIFTRALESVAWARAYARTAGE